MQCSGERKNAVKRAKDFPCLSSLTEVLSAGNAEKMQARENLAGVPWTPEESPMLERSGVSGDWSAADKLSFQTR
jgi:hypothetical protein